MTANDCNKSNEQQTRYTAKGRKALRILVCFSFALLMVCVRELPVAAGSPNDRILNYVKDNFPTQLYEEHLPLAENLLSQVALSDEQATAIIEKMAQVKTIPSIEKGASLSEYSQEERQQVLGIFKEVCDIAEVRYEMIVSQGSSSKDNMIAVFYHQDGTKIGELDMDAVNKTNTADRPPYEFAVTAMLFFLFLLVSLNRSRSVTA